MFTDILEPLLVHNTTLDGLDLSNIRCLNKASRDAINWDFVRRLYRPITSVESKKKGYSEGSRYGPCDTCGEDTNLRPSSGIGMLGCSRCQKVISVKTASKTFHLDADDVRGLAKSRINFGHWGVSFRAALGVALMKHGGPARLKVIMMPRYMQSKAYKNRAEKLEKLDLSPTEKKTLKRPLDKYMRNGRGGIRAIESPLKNLRRYEDIVGGLPEHLKMIANTYPDFKNDFVVWGQTREYFCFRLKQCFKIVRQEDNRFAIFRNIL